MLAGFLPLLVLAAIVYGVVRLIGRRDAGPDGVSPEGDLREIVGRIFRLGLLAAAIALLAEGLAALITEALPVDELARDSFRIARALSFTIVGIPAVGSLAWWTRRQLETDPKEARSVVWAAFTGGLLVVALGIAIANLFIVLEWLLGDGPADPDARGGAVGRLISWSIVLGLFWWLNRQRPGAHTPTHTPAYILAGSAIGLGVAAFRVWELLRALLREAIDPLWDDILVGPRESLTLSVALAVVSIGVWLFFWWFNGRTSARTERWYAYVLLGGVLSGVVTAIWAAGVLVNLTLQWFLGDPGSDTAAGHFESMPGAISALIVGGLIWFHHRDLLADRPADEAATRTEPDRVYDHLGAAAGLGLLAAAVTIVVAALIEAVVEADVARGSVTNTVINAATLALIGVPLMLQFWGRAQRQAAADIEEIRSPTRRVYLIAALGISAATALIALVISLTIFFEDLADGDLSGNTLFRFRYGLGLIIITAIIAAYHFLVYREDRSVLEAAGPPPPTGEPEVAAGEPIRQRLVVTGDFDEARALLADPDGPDAVLITRRDDVDVAALLPGDFTRTAPS